MILSLISENASFNDQDLLGDMLMRQFKVTNTHNDKLCLAVKKSYTNTNQSRASSPKKQSLMTAKSKKILQNAGIK